MATVQSAVTTSVQGAPSAVTRAIRRAGSCPTDRAKPASSVRPKSAAWKKNWSAWVRVTSAQKSTMRSSKRGSSRKPSMTASIDAGSSSTDRISSSLGSTPRRSREARNNSGTGSREGMSAAVSATPPQAEPPPGPLGRAAGRTQQHQQHAGTHHGATAQPHSAEVSVQTSPWYSAPT